MTQRVSELLQERKAKHLGTLIGYFPAGYPTVEDSIDAAVAMCESGCQILELGVPYSDPVMDGPVIQEATELALAHGFKLRRLFEVISGIRQKVQTPILVMSYWNPIMQYGVTRFAEDLKMAGAQGLITPDLIPDEAKDWLRVSDELNLERVFLGAPTSDSERISNTTKLSRGFVYAVSTMGITGTRDEVDVLARKVVSGVRNSNPEQNVCVGIGISTAEQVLEVNQYSDGAIVGSAFVRAYQNQGLTGLRDKVSELASLLEQ